MHQFRVEAWNPGNGVSFSADVVDYFQAVNLFDCASRRYRRVVLVRLADGHEEKRHAVD